MTDYPFFFFYFLIQFVFEYPPKWYTYSAVWLLHGWCHVKLLPSLRVLCTPYNHAPCLWVESDAMWMLLRPLAVLPCTDRGLGFFEACWLALLLFFAWAVLSQNVCPVPDVRPAPECPSCPRMPVLSHRASWFVFLLFFAWTVLSQNVRPVPECPSCPRMSAVLLPGSYSEGIHWEFHTYTRCRG